MPASRAFGSPGQASRARGGWAPLWRSAASRPSARPRGGRERTAAATQAQARYRISTFSYLLTDRRAWRRRRLQSEPEAGAWRVTPRDGAAAAAWRRDRARAPRGSLHVGRVLRDASVAFYTSSRQRPVNHRSGRASSFIAGVYDDALPVGWSRAASVL